jgi:hypothetical protein
MYTYVRALSSLGTSVNESGQASSEARSDHTGSRCSGFGLRGLLLLSVFPLKLGQTTRGEAVDISGCTGSSSSCLRCLRDRCCGP